MNEFKCVVYSETGVWWDNFFGIDGKGEKKIWKKMLKKKNLNWISLHKYPINEEKIKKNID